MKTRFKVLLGTSLLVPVLAVSIVAAHEEETTTTDKPGRTVALTTSPDEKLTLEQRIEKRKAEIKIQLSNAEKLRITQKCKASQGSISSLKGRITGLDTSRSNVYKNLTSRLTKLTDRLKAQGVDTAKLEADLATLATKIETFHTDLANYRVVVSDLAEMQCADDPTAFKTSLEASRAAREKVYADAADIRKFVNETLKPTLQDIRKQLDANKTEDGNN